MSSRPPSHDTLALLHAYLPGSEQHEIVAQFHKTASLLERHLRTDALARLNDNMHGALVSFCMDLGFPFFAQSTLRHRVNAGRFLEAVAQFLPCCSRQGKPDRTMKARRHAEANLFCSFTG